MLLTEYDEKKTMRLFRKEAKEEGRKEGIKEGIKEGQYNLIAAMLQNGVSAEHISEITNLPLQEIKNVQTLIDS